MPDPIAGIIENVSPDNIREWLYYLCEDPLPYRKLNYTLPGHGKCTLHEADDFIEGKLKEWGWQTERDETRVQAYRCDETENIHHRYSPPAAEDPWYTAHNVYAKKAGSATPEEIIVAIAHKDSQSWVDSPGANDNTIGTVGILEMARVLADYQSRRSLWFIWCNEEHSPWTSITAAQAAKVRGDNIVAVFNVDGIGRKSPEDTEAGLKTHRAGFTESEGEALADIVLQVNEDYHLGLIASKFRREHPGDDDGSFVKAGYPAALMNIGCYPYKDPNYHLPGDRWDTVDVPNAALSAKALIAAILRVDAGALSA